MIARSAILVTGLGAAAVAGAGGCSGPAESAKPTAGSAASAGKPRPRDDADRPSAPDDPDAKGPPMSPDAQGKIPIEEVAKYPVPGTSTPTRVAFSPDGDAITYLWSPDKSLTRQLFALDPKTGERSQIVKPPDGGATEDNLSAEEKLRRERQRERGLGVTRYSWAKDAARLLVPLRGDLYVQDGTAGELTKIVDAEGRPALDARFSRDGAHVGYVQADELFVVSATGGKPRQITKGAAAAGVAHGVAEYIAQEEMSRSTGWWFSNDAKWLAYTEIDESHIPTYRINHQGKDKPEHEDHGYPFAGEANAKVKLGVVSANGGRTKWLELGLDGEPATEDLYLARVKWMPDGTLTAQVENREQTRLDLWRFDPRSGKRTLLLTESSEVWINLHNMMRPLEEATGELEGAFVWGSERTGFRHLYLHDATGKPIRALTEGEWMVDALEGVDEKRGRVYFTATKDGPTERHLYWVSLEGGEIHRLTPEPGSHGIEFDKAFDRFIDHHSDLGNPTKITVRAVDDGKVLHTIHDEVDPRIAELGLTPPELVTVNSREGVTLHGAVYKPEGDGPFPTIVSVYGGPHAQRVTNSWGMTADMRAQYLRGLGYLVFKLDNRGSARRGLAFEGAIRHDMGNLEVQDQVDGVKWLVEQGLADPERVAIYGWSYGGYMAAMALCRAPETFKVGVAGAPVSHWDGYDTHYTERYMGTPQSNPKGYESSAVMTHVDDMTGSLLLVHGLIDENVHFRHTARLINALVAARKDHELLLFPDERHMPRREEDRVYMESRIRDFFRAKL